MINELGKNEEAVNTYLTKNSFWDDEELNLSQFFNEQLSRITAKSEALNRINNSYNTNDYRNYEEVPLFELVKLKLRSCYCI